MLNIRRNVIFSFAEVCTGSVLAFVSYRVVVRIGGIQLLGIWSAIMAWVGLSRLGDLGLGGASTRFVAALDVDKDRERVCGFIDTAVIANFCVICALTALSYFAVSHWLELAVGQENLDVAQSALPWLVFSVICSNLCTIVTGALFSLHIGFIRSIIMITGNILQLVLVVSLVPRHGIVGFAIAQIIQYILATIAAWLAICIKIGSFRLPNCFSWKLLKEMMNVSLMLQAANIANTLFEPLSKVLVGHFGGMQMQGLYEASYKTMATTRNISSTTATATLPALTRYAQTDIPAAQQLYLKTKKNIIKALLFIFGSVTLASPLISLMLFREVYVQFVVFVALLAVGSFVGGWCTPAYYLGQATGKLNGVVIAMFASDCLLLVGGGALGSAGYPAMIVALASTCMVLSNLLVLRLNEPLIGLGKA